MCGVLKRGGGGHVGEGRHLFEKGVVEACMRNRS